MLQGKNNYNPFFSVELSDDELTFIVTQELIEKELNKKEFPYSV